MKFETVKELTEKAVAQTLGSEYMTSADGNIKPLESFRAWCWRCLPHW